MWKLLLLLLMRPLDELSGLLELCGVPGQLGMQLLQRCLHHTDLIAHCFDLAVSIMEGLVILVLRLLAMTCC
jgi:hypothetical protein